MPDISYTGAFIAGLLSFFTPCILPMVPFYLSYMAGVSVNELREDGEIAPNAQRRLVLQSIMFSLGVTTIFVLLGIGATAIGQVFANMKDVLSYVSAAILIVFGLHFLGLVRIPILYREARLESSASPATFIGAYLMGLAFGFGWTPCVGPALAAILMIAAGMGDVVQGGLLLLVYGLSMTLPFVIAGLFSRPFLAWVQRNRHLMGSVEKVMGVLLIVFAIFIATGTVNIISGWMLEIFPGFAKIG